MFISTKSNCQQRWPGYTLIQPCISVGLVGQLTVDLLLNNISDIKKIGYFYDKCFTPVVGADPFSNEDTSSNICSSCEVFESKSHKLVIIQQRAPFIKGRIPCYRRKLIEWLKNCNFKEIVIVGSCSSHIKTNIDMERSTLFYLASKEFSNLGAKFENDLKWKKFSHRRQDILDEAVGKQEIYIPGGGIMKSLYDECCSHEVPVFGILAFNNDGNGIQDAVNLAEGFNNLHITLKESKIPIKDSKESWHIPSSWNGIDKIPKIPNIY